MKKILLFALWLMPTVTTPIFSQNNEQVVEDFRVTMQHFFTTLNDINISDRGIEERLYDLAATFGSSEYFIRNGEQMTSFQDWLHTYCRDNCKGMLVMHSMKYYKDSIRKVDKETDSDRRYQMDIILKRNWLYQGAESPLPDERLIVTFVWQGAQKYVTIVGLDGIISPLPDRTNRNNDWAQVAAGYFENDEAEKGLEILFPLAEKDNVEAIKMLARIYMNGIGVTQDVKKGFQYWMKAAEMEEPTAMNEVGYCYHYGEGGLPKDERKAVRWYAKAAEKGHILAMLNLGICYENGQGVDCNIQRAIKWYEKAAENGNASAQLNMGQYYFEGKGLPLDYQKAFQWFEKAAMQGEAVAQFYLGVCYENGQGINQNIGKAIEWYTKAAEQNLAEAQFNLGFSYENGQGVPQNSNKAFYWYNKSAVQGYEKAEFSLGLCYYYGNGVEQNYETAIQWFQKAAEKNVVEAMFNLGLCYENPQDIRDSCILNMLETWYSMEACSSGQSF